MEEKQSAETAETLIAQLAQANQRIAQMSHDLSDLEIEQSLTCKLAAAGATDLEAAVLMAKARMEGKDETEIDDCIEQLRKEKSYLFGGSAQMVTSRKTSGAKDRKAQSQTALEQAARKAARTGRRTDLQHYLKLRRNLL
jgi:transketolase